MRYPPGRKTPYLVHWLILVNAQGWRSPVIPEANQCLGWALGRRKCPTMGNA
ncbi:hypothetical protein [Synechocystis sp. CACIAM 05]|uniref:hypothetical protein n=1 Tax=Synechocystis sp. CACIAM 05 TaxID=1933929 RepID=UPI001391B741|nr:hypothetical protein [Synechocystis sp. CACIAM 05]